MLLSREEQARIGVTPDKSDSIRVMRVLSEYDRLRSDNARLTAELKSAWETYKEIMAENRTIQQ